MFFKKKPKPMQIVKTNFRQRDPHVQIIVVTKDKVEEGCWDALIGQDYPNFGVAVHVMKAEHYHSNGDVNGVFNIERNRNLARRMALATDSEFFLLVDSDVVLPKDALTNLMLHKKDFIAGWYQIKKMSPMSPSLWPVAIMRGNTAFYFKKPTHSLVMADWSGLGCCLISRALYERVEHRNAMHHIMQTDVGVDVLVDEATQFCIDAKSVGYQLYMNGDVMCDHLVRKTEEDSYDVPQLLKKVGQP